MSETLKLAYERKCQFVAFSLISSDTYGYPRDHVLRFAIEIITKFLYEHEMMGYICVLDCTSYEFSQILYAELSRVIAVDDEEEFLTVAPDIAECSSVKGKTFQKYMKEMAKSFAYKPFASKNCQLPFYI